MGRCPGIIDSLNRRSHCMTTTDREGGPAWGKVKSNFEHPTDIQNPSHDQKLGYGDAKEREDLHDVETTGRRSGTLPKVYKWTVNIRPLPHGESMKYTRFEKARIIGARSLQVSLGAPVLIDIPENMIDPVAIAMLEFERDVLPITVKRDE